MAQQDENPYGLMPSLSAAPAGYVPPITATAGLGLSAVTQQQMALQKQLAQEEEQRRKEREAEMQRQGKQIADIGSKTYRPDLMAAGASLQAGGLASLAPEMFQTAADTEMVSSITKTLEDASTLAKMLTPASAKAYMEHVTRNLPTVGGVPFEFRDTLGKVNATNRSAVQTSLGKIVADRISALQEQLKTPGMLATPEDRKTAAANLAQYESLQNSMPFLSDTDLETQWDRVTKQTGAVTIGERTGIAQHAGTETKIVGDREVTYRRDGAGNTILVSTRNLSPTEMQAFRMQMARGQAERATRSLESLLASRDFSRANTLIERARKDRVEGRQKERLDLAQRLYDLRVKGSDRADLETSLKIAQYFNPSMNPAQLTKDAYDQARSVLEATLSDDKGVPVRTLLNSRSQADREAGERLIQEKIDEQAAEMLRQTLDQQTRFWKSQPELLNNLFENLGRAPRGLPLLPESPTGAPGAGSTVPPPPALPGGGGLSGALPPASSAPAAELPGLPGVRAPRLPAAPPPVPAPPPVAPASRPGTGSSRVASPKGGPATLRDAVGTPAERGFHIRRPTER